MFKKIEITKVSIEGFKGYKERVEFLFSPLTSIYAGNGKGKTSIGEAIVWAFLGSNLWGNDKFDAKLLNHSSKYMSVTVDFNEGDQKHSITRSKGNGPATIILDNRTKKQHEISAMIGSKDIFLSIFNPEYFLKKSSKEGRDILISILRDIQISEVVEKIDEFYYKFIKDDIVLVHADPNSFMKEKRTEIEDLKKDIIFAEGVISKLTSKDEVLEYKEFDVSQIEQLEEKFANLTTKPNIELVNQIEGYRKKKQALELESSILKAKEYRNSKDTNLEQRELIKLENNISSLNMEKFEPSDEVKKEIFTLENKITELKIAYRKAKETPLNKGDKCPTCKTIISEPHLLILESDKDGVLAELEQEGKALSKKLSEFKEKTALTIKGLEDIRDKKKAELELKQKELKERILLIEKEIETEKSVFLKNKEEKLAELKQSIIDTSNLIAETELKLNEEQKENDSEISKERTLIKNTLISLRKEKMEVDAYNIELKLKAEQREKELKELEKINNEIVVANNNINYKQNQIDSCKQYIALKVEILSEFIHSNLDNVTIVLQKVVKTSGELKDCFEINYNGTGHYAISKSETIKTGIEISNLIRNVTDLNYPIFIDNKESITSYDAPNVQIIEATVSDEVAEVVVVVARTDDRIA